jgi:MATE family multidrug resistance protein
MPAFGFASAGAIMVGEAIGRRAHDDVWPIVKLCARVTCTFMGSIALVYWAFSSTLMRFFSPENARDLQLVEVGSIMLGLSAVWQLFDAVGITLGETLRAAGDTTWCMAVRICLAWLVFAPLGWAFVVVFEGGVHAVMGALIAYLGLLALALSYRFASGRWRNIDMVGEPSVI